LRLGVEREHSKRGEPRKDAAKQPLQHQGEALTEHRAH
jgi:hypothetical protein